MKAYLPAKLLLSLSIVGLLSFPQQFAQAQLYGAGEAAQTAGIATGGQTSIVAVMANVISAGLSLVGVLFFILTIYGGVTWMLARGNEEYTKRALSTIVAAVIGLIIVVAAYAITQFVFTSVIG